MENYKYATHSGKSWFMFNEIFALNSLIAKSYPCDIRSLYEFGEYPVFGHTYRITHYLLYNKKRIPMRDLTPIGLKDFLDYCHNNYKRYDIHMYHDSYIQKLIKRR